jgi:hypothetical protein
MRLLGSERQFQVTDDPVDDRLEAALIFGQEAFGMMEDHPVQDRALRMARTIDSRHIGGTDSKIVPRDRETTSAGRTKKPLMNGDPQNLGFKPACLQSSLAVIRSRTLCLFTGIVFLSFV